MKTFFCEKVLAPIIVPVLKIVLPLFARRLKEPKETGAYEFGNPAINDTITTDHALTLCKKYDFNILVDRLMAHPEHYKSWSFDGVSMLPEGLARWLTKAPNITEIAQRHDLKYAYGESGNSEEKRAADLELKQEIIDNGGRRWVAELLFCLVETFGKEEYGFDFSWCFAHKEKKILK